MSDPLSLLRQYNIDKKEIVESDNQIIFGENSFPKTLKTNYLISQKGTEDKDYYTLESLLFFLKKKHLFHPEYCKEAGAANIIAVRRPDRKKILDYLNGETETSTSIDKTTSKTKVPSKKSMSHARQGKPNFDKEVREPAAKRTRREP